MTQYVMIPHERIGVLIGPQAAVKRAIEERTGCELRISSSTGTVEIGHADPLMVLRTREIVLAIGRGFNPKKAMRLFDDEALVFEIIDISEYASSEKDIKRVNGRIIGAGGKMREHFEVMTGSSISIYGKTVSIIGYPEQNRVVRTGIEMLINGSPHGTVYNFLERKHKSLKQQEMND